MMYDREYFEDGTKSNYHGYHDIPQYEGYAEAIEHLFQPQNVLEVGCAMGFVVKKLREKGIEAYGVDVSEYAVEKAESEYVSLADAEKPLPFPDKHFDLVVSFDMLEHIPQDKVPIVISEMKRVGRRQYHHITYRENEPGKDISHVTLRPIWWWYEQFGDGDNIYLKESY